MVTIKLIISADDEIRALRLACSQLSDQTEDHFAILCGILVGHVVEQTPQSVSVMINNVISHLHSVEALLPHDILDCCLRLFGKISLQCMHSHILLDVTTVYLLETNPHLIVGVVCYYEGGLNPQ